MDLQKLIHEDITTHLKEYYIKTPDANIDHRRVRNISNYFNRIGFSEINSQNMDDYQPGDIICFMDDIGILVNKQGDVYHMGPSEAIIATNYLFQNQIYDHFRIKNLNK